MLRSERSRSLAQRIFKQLPEKLTITYQARQSVCISHACHAQWLQDGGFLDNSLHAQRSIYAQCPAGVDHVAGSLATGTMPGGILKQHAGLPTCACIHWVSLNSRCGVGGMMCRLDMSVLSGLMLLCGGLLVRLRGPELKAIRSLFSCLAGRPKTFGVIATFLCTEIAAVAPMSAQPAPKAQKRIIIS